MTNAMNYKGYFARVDFDGRDNTFVGHVLGVDDRISFHGETVTELTEDFHAAVDHYLSDCEQAGRNPQKPASGKLMLRIDPDVHARVGIAAAISGESVVTDRRNGAGEDRRKGATWKGSETRFRTPSRMLVFGPFFNA